MRVGIVGGGVSGMVAAWLLQDEHEVTLLEAAPRLGGHAETVPVEVSGRTVFSEVGARFFFDSAYPHFLALLRLLDVKVAWRDATVSFTDLRTSRTRVLPPRSARHVASLLGSPRLLRHVLTLRRLVREQAEVAGRRDFVETLREHLEARGYPAAFGPELAYPLLAACWGAPLATLPDFPAYSLLKGMPPGKRPGYYAIDGGMSRYVRALADALDRVEVQLGAGVRRIERSDGFSVEDEAGRRRRFDRLIVATPAWDAARLLDGVKGVAELRASASLLRSFDANIVVHGDRSWMPRSGRDWAHTNLSWDGSRAWMTDWQGIDLGLPVFRTWLPKGAALPRQIHARRSFRHVLMTKEHAALQQRIADAQGAAGLWLTGMYAVDVDNHESALLSAVVPALALSPRSPALARLLAAVAPDAVHGLDVLPVSRAATPTPEPSRACYDETPTPP